MTQAQMTEQQFRAFVAQATHCVDCSLEGLDSHSFEMTLGIDGAAILRPKTWGFFRVVATFSMDDAESFQVAFQRCVEWEGSEKERFSNDVTTYAPSKYEWALSGLTLLGDDEDGELLSGCCVIELLEEIFGKSGACNLIGHDYTPYIPAIAVQDIDVDQESDMGTFTLDCDGAPEVRFAGEKLASASSRSTPNDGGRWAELHLYRTIGGKFICQTIGQTNWQGEKNRYKVEVAIDHAGVIQAFGRGWLAKELYEKARIQDVFDVA